MLWGKQCESLSTEYGNLSVSDIKELLGLEYKKTPEYITNVGAKLEQLIGA